MEIISTLFIGFWSFVAIFCTCELGEQVADTFIKFNDEIGQCRWYTFPIELQRMLATVILNAQQPVIIQGYGRALCTRNAFNKVKSASSSLSVAIMSYGAYNSFRQSKVDFPTSWCFVKSSVALPKCEKAEESTKWRWKVGSFHQNAGFACFLRKI